MPAGFLYPKPTGKYDHPWYKPLPKGRARAYDLLYMSATTLLAVAAGYTFFETGRGSYYIIQASRARSKVRGTMPWSPRLHKVPLLCALWAEHVHVASLSVQGCAYSWRACPWFRVAQGVLLLATHRPDFFCAGMYLLLCRKRLQLRGQSRSKACACNDSCLSRSSFEKRPLGAFKISTSC